MNRAIVRKIFTEYVTRTCVYILVYLDASRKPLLGRLSTKRESQYVKSKAMKAERSYEKLIDTQITLYRYLEILNPELSILIYEMFSRHTCLLKEYLDETETSKRQQISNNMKLNAEALALMLGESMSYELWRAQLIMYCDFSVKFIHLHLRHELRKEIELYSYYHDYAELLGDMIFSLFE